MVRQRFTSHGVKVLNTWWRWFMTQILITGHWQFTVLDVMIIGRTSRDRWFWDDKSKLVVMDNLVSSAKSPRMRNFTFLLSSELGNVGCLLEMRSSWFSIWRSLPTSSKIGLHWLISIQHRRGTKIQITFRFSNSLWFIDSKLSPKDKPKRRSPSTASTWIQRLF